MSSIKYLNFKILWHKKNKVINWIVNNIGFEQNLTCILKT